MYKKQQNMLKTIYKQTDIRQDNQLKNYQQKLKRL